MAIAVKSYICFASVIKCFGWTHRCQVICGWLYFLSVYCWMVILQGRKTAARVHPWSMIVRIASNPLLSGSAVIRSMVIIWNGRVSQPVVILYGRVRFGWIDFLFCWHVVHPLTYSAIHGVIWGHQNVLVTLSSVLSLPGWPAVGASW